MFGINENHAKGAKKYRFFVVVRGGGLQCVLVKFGEKKSSENFVIQRSNQNTPIY